MSRIATRLALAALASASAAAHAQTLDTVVPLLSSSVLLSGGGSTTWAFTYDPATDTGWAGVQIGSGQNIRRITGVTTSPAITTVLDSTALNTWGQLGESRTGSLFPFGLAMNPAPVGSVATRGNLWVSDIGTINQISSSTADPSASPAFWRYNLQSVPTSGTNAYSNLSQVLTRVASRADQQIASAGVTNTAFGTSIGRQPAFSSDGRWLFALDNGSAARYPGIYRIDPVASGGMVRLSTPVTTSTACEPAAVKVGSVYRVYYRGVTYSDALTSVDHNPTTNTTGPETVALSAAQLNDFMESSATPSISNLASDTDGNLYFYDGNTSGGGNLRLLRLDPQGRLVKVLTHTERSTAIPGTVFGMNRLQAVPYTHPTAGQITRLFWLDSVAIGISSVLAFKPTDFDRNGVEGTSDLPGFLAALGTRGSSSPLSNARYDLNGNGSVDWRDVKTLQSFRPALRDGDANLDGLVDFTDLSVLRDHYLGSSKTWAQGDFASATANYPTSAPDANTVDYTDLLTLSNTWLNVLSQPKPTISQLDANGYTGQFRADVITAFSISLPVSWSAAGSGAWATGGNWSTGTAPGGAGSEVLFGNVLSSPATVDLGGPRTAGSIAFDSPTRAYTLASGTLTLDATSGPASLTVSAGSHAVSANLTLADPANVSVAAGSTLTVSGTLARGANSLSVSGGGTLAVTGPATGSGNVSVSSATLTASTPLRPVTGTLSVTGAGAVATLAAAPTPNASGTWTFAGEFASVTATAGGSVVLPAADRSTSKASVLIAGPLSLTAGGFLDLATNDAVLRNTTPETVRALLASNALRSSSAGANTALGYLAATTAFGFPAFTTFDGVAVGGSDVVVKYTYKGDTDLNGLLDARDFAAVLSGWSNNLTGWSNGDSNHDGVVNATDWSAFLAAYTAGLPSLGNPFASGEGSGAAIPEPAALSLLAPATLLLSRRRR